MVIDRATKQWRLVFAAALALAVGLAVASNAKPPHCAKGTIPCGSTCVLKGKVCHAGRSKAFFDDGGSQLYLSRIYKGAPPGNSIAVTNTVVAPKP